ncbi:hypothetical protein [uncultured Desulfosarcina sp.]|uniref:hypothetical protein n=1 Tax=uncultured Desulfosarcina sp. TaxID=218289 RepID=UPI0029C76196|nr:hypothetical protein [uncultured Desulfosarcina sp.]
MNPYKKMKDTDILNSLYEKRVLIILLVLLGSAILTQIIYISFGRVLVADIYYERSFSFLNDTMANRAHWSLERYFARADRLVHQFHAVVAILLIVTIFYAFSRKMAYFFSTKKIFFVESFQGDSEPCEIANAISRRAAGGALLLTLIVASGPLYFSKFPPLLDYPWHLARIYILDNWQQLPLLQRWYDIRSFILPNIGMDLVTLSLSKIFSVELAGRIFIFIVFALMVSGSMCIYRAVYCHYSLWPLVSALFLFNSIFIFGFLNYLLGIGLFLWAIGIWVLIRNSNPFLRFFTGTVLTTVLFFCHIAALGLFAVTIAGYEWQRSCRTILTSEQTADRDLFIGAAIFFLPCVLYILSSTSDHVLSRIVYAQPWFGQKLSTFFMSLLTRNWMIDAPMLVLLALFFIGIRPLGRIRIAKSMYSPIAMVLIAYFVLPYDGLLSGAYIDTRIPIAIVLFVIGCSRLIVKKKVWQRVTEYGLFCFLIFQSVFLSYDWQKYEAIIQDFTMVFSRLPAGAIMFVTSGAKEPVPAGDRFQWQPPILHLGSLATLQQNVFVPVTWAHPSKQAIAVSERYEAIKAFQGNSPIEINTAEELSNFISQAKGLINMADFPADSVFLLVIDPRQILFEGVNQAKIVASGSRFALLHLLV